MKAESLSSFNELSNTAFKARFINGMKRPRHVKAKYAKEKFLSYSPLKRDFGRYKIPVHNEGIGQKMRSSYTLEQFRQLYSFADSKGTFDYVLNPKTGFVKTSFINRKENELMSDLIWITDTCNNMELVKAKSPEDCTKVFNKLTDFYTNEQQRFDSTIANPERYKENPFYDRATQVGVGHCFVPTTHQPHVWFTKTRLESVGNYLQVASDLIMNGFAGAKYGYKNAAEVPNSVVNAISNSTKYLTAINYPQARSCGAWEEQTFVNSLTSDTAVINQGFRDVIELMYSDTTDKNLLELRKRILHSKNGDVFNDKDGLESLLKSGEQRVVERPFVETKQGDFSKPVSKDDEKCLRRDNDAALGFVFQTEKFSDDVYKDTLFKLAGLNKLQRGLVRDNGMLRYKDDEYLNLDYHTLKDKWHDNKKSNEAEWFLVSEMASSYGKIFDNLINYVRENGLTAKAKKFLDKVLEKETEYINRSYARITPKNMVKSNEYSCPAYKVPEAYEAVTTAKGIKYVPGAHPLTWAESSLHKASTIFEKNLKDMKDLNIQG